jgi:hypothetical protein
VRVFNIELDTSEQVLHFGQVRGNAIHKELGDFVLGDLPGDDEFFAILVPCGAHLLLYASELDGD